MRFPYPSVPASVVSEPGRRVVVSVGTGKLRTNLRGHTPPVSVCWVTDDLNIANVKHLARERLQCGDCGLEVLTQHHVPPLGQGIALSPFKTDVVSIGLTSLSESQQSSQRQRSHTPLHWCAWGLRFKFLESFKQSFSRVSFRENIDYSTFYKMLSDLWDHLAVDVNTPASDPVVQG